MKIQSKLCHYSENKVIVEVNGWVNDKSVGSALAEGSTVEDAEDSAIVRLKKRNNILNNSEKTVTTHNPNKINQKIKVELPKNEIPENRKLDKELFE